MSRRLALQFLGIPQLSLDNTPITTDRRKAVALLAYLAMNHGKQTREFLSGLFWPDYEQAKAFSNLRRTIWEVHQAIGENWLIADRESVRLNPEAEIDFDVALFQDLLAQSQEQIDPTFRIPLLSEAANLYRNHFLTGFSLKDAYPFNEWAYAESEELRRQLAEALSSLTEDYCALGQAENAIPYARRLISLDALNESAHRLLMNVYLQAGQHGAALKQYQTCEQILRKELNLDPQPETRELYRKIRKGEIKPAHIEKPISSITPKHNLPSQLSSFIGREREQDEIIKLIAKHRLVTLAGVGGIGKTSLSLQVGKRLLHDYPDGVWFIPLDSLSDAALVPQTIASVFDIREGSDRSVTETLVNVLCGKATLLILDNCEHLLDACSEFIATLLQNCSTLKILVTSRELINLAGEASYYVPTLPIPEENVAENLEEYGSVQLFAERAGLAFSSFALTKENANTVVEICRLLDGIPLAIELAAARVNILKPEEILKQLHTSFALLARSTRGITSRHQTTQASMDWSWGLLTESERIFLRHLSVFAGGWTLESAQAVCDGDVLTLTSALVKKSLIVVKQEVGRETRYRFHEIVRQYMREKLIESGEEGVIRTRHLQYFLQLSEQAEPGLRGPSQVEWISHLNDERDNSRAALEWAEKTDVEAGLYLCGRLLRFWERFDVRELNHWLSTFLQNPESHIYPKARVLALDAHLWVLNFLGEVDTWESTATECLELYRSLGDQRGEVDLLILATGEISGDEQRMELFHRAYGDSQTMVDDIWRQARTFLLLGWSCGGDQRFDYWRQAIKLFRQSGDWYWLAHLLSNNGTSALLNGDLELAQKNLDEASMLNDHLKDKFVRSNILIGYGQIAIAVGDYEKAHLYLQEAEEITEDLGIRLHLLFIRTHLGYLALREGNINEARHLFVETVTTFQRDKNVNAIAFALEGMAGLYVATNKPTIAARLIGWSDATRKKIEDTRPLLEQADVDQIIAACIIKIGEAAFSDAYDEGQKMTLDEAVEYALEETK